MQTKDIFNKLQTKFGTNIVELVELENVLDPFIVVLPDEIKNITMFLRDNNEMQFDYLSMISGVDDKDSIWAVYHLYSIPLKHKLVLKIKLNRNKPIVPTVERVWKTANWHEREAFDMFGIEFDGHPDLDRILCPEDWVGYPLRKDYVAPTVYNGIDATPNKI